MADMQSYYQVVQNTDYNQERVIC